LEELTEMIERFRPVKLVHILKNNACLLCVTSQSITCRSIL